MGLVLLGVSVLTFFIAHVVPADPVLAALGEHAREDQIQAYRHAYGLDRPVGVQYRSTSTGCSRETLGFLFAPGGRSLRTWGSSSRRRSNSAARPGWWRCCWGSRRGSSPRSTKTGSSTTPPASGR